MNSLSKKQKSSISILDLQQQQQIESLYSNIFQYPEYLEVIITLELNSFKKMNQYFPVPLLFKKPQQKFQQYQSLTARKKLILFLILQYKLRVDTFINSKFQSIYPSRLYFVQDWKAFINLDGCQIKPLVIEPIFEINNEILTQKMGLNDLEFINCIDMSGFFQVQFVKERKTGKY